MRYLLSTWLILVLWDSFSQNMATIRKWNEALLQAENDSVKAAIYSELNYEWAEFNFDSSWYYAEMIEKIGIKTGDKELLRNALVSKGVAHDYQYHYDSALFYYRKSADLAKETGNQRGEAVALFNIGVMHNFNGEVELAIENYNKAGMLFSEIGDRKMLGRLYNNLGVVYRRAGRHSLAKDTYLNSLEVKTELSDEAGMLNTLSNLSAVSTILGEYQEAISYSERAIVLAKKLENQSAYLHELVNLAAAYKHLEQIPKAISLYEEAESMFGDDASYETKTQVLIGLSQFYFEEGKLTKAKAIIKRLEPSLELDQGLEAVFNCYHQAYKIHKALGEDQEALVYLEKASDIRTQLFDNEVLTKTTELEQLYEKEKRENEIIRLNAENEFQSVSLEQERRTRNWFIAFTGLSGLVAFLLYYLYYQKRRSLEERETLLREIHHRVKNNLQIISSLLSLQAGSLSDQKAKDAVLEGQNRVKSMSLIHQKLYSTADIRGVDIQEYFEHLTAELFASYGVDQEKVRYQVSAHGLKLDIDTVIPLGLILNELLTNALKYAFTAVDQGLLELSFQEQEGNLVVVVRDNGPGMKNRPDESPSSFGWKLIHSLSRKIKAQIEVTSENGTCVQLLISRYKVVE